jgi:ABC-type dipeptide/oligopeptide/nickel transport system ATPase component
MRAIRGRRISMVFQNAMTALDPFFRVGDQLVEIIQLHQRMGRREARAKALEALELVRIPEAGRRLSSYPHQLSGGQRQRVMIALALAGEPKLLLADEPTSALDATLARELMLMLVSLAEELGTSVLLVSHDIQLCQEFTDRTIIMRDGKIVEERESSRLARYAEHPYTQGLLACVPSLDTALLDELPTMNRYLPEAVR